MMAGNPRTLTAVAEMSIILCEFPYAFWIPILVGDPIGYESCMVKLPAMRGASATLSAGRNRARSSENVPPQMAPATEDPIAPPIELKIDSMAKTTAMYW